MCFDVIALSNTIRNNLKRCLLLPRFKEKCVSLEKNTHNHTNRQKSERTFSYWKRRYRCISPRLLNRREWKSYSAYHMPARKQSCLWKSIGSLLTEIQSEDKVFHIRRCDCWSLLLLKGHRNAFRNVLLLFFWIPLLFLFRQRRRLFLLRRNNAWF